MSTALEPEPGWRAPEVEEELPGLGLLACEVTVGRAQELTGPSPPDIEQRMRALSNQFRGARAIGIRREPIPAAYRIFFRQIGLDPDIVRTPIEAAVLERMIRGGFLTGGLLEDVLLIALLDTGVPVWALDAETVQGELGIRPGRDAEPLGRSAQATPQSAGTLLVADSTHALAVLFGGVAAAHRARADTRRLRIFTLQVAGVPALYAEEALWNVKAALEAP